MTIYETLRAVGVPTDNHETDLYAKVTPESEAIICAYEFYSNVRRFQHAVDGTQWFDIPFAYDPAWVRKSS